MQVIYFAPGRLACLLYPTLLVLLGDGERERKKS
jgi:hypothetical protein